MDGEEGDYAEEEEQQQLAVLGNELVTPGVAKLVSYGVRNVLELPAPPNWDAGASDDETETQDDETEMQEDDDSDSELEIATTKKKKPLGAVNTPPKVSSAGKRGTGKQRKDVVTKENVDDPYDDANLDAPAAKAART